MLLGLSPGRRACVRHLVGGGGVPIRWAACTRSLSQAAGAAPVDPGAQKVVIVGLLVAAIGLSSASWNRSGSGGVLEVWASDSPT
jgi:hypothetical protein